MAQRYRIQHGDLTHAVETQGDGVVLVDSVACTVTPHGPSHYKVAAPDGRVTVVTLAGSSSTLWASAGGRAYELEIDASARARTGTRAAAGDMTPPMPATVVKVIVAVGAAVETGAPVVILEAMKMELTIRAAHAGVIRAVRCAVGDLVRPGTVLVEIDQ